VTAPSITVGDRLPVTEHTPTNVQLFRFSSATWNSHRIHYDIEYAKTEGYPDVLVQSHLHASLLVKAVLEWAGGTARLKRFRWENRAIAVPGDTLTYSGEITAVTETDSAVVVECALESHNQDGVLCAPGWATVEIPKED